MENLYLTILSIPIQVHDISFFKFFSIFYLFIGDREDRRRGGGAGGGGRAEGEGQAGSSIRGSIPGP